MSPRVAFPFVGDTIGGSHISAALLMGELPALGYTPVAVVHQGGPLTEWLADRKIPLVRADLPFLSGQSGAVALARLALIAPKLSSFLRRENFSLVHANDGRMIASWMPAARLAGIKSLAHRRTKWTPSRLAHLSLRMAGAIVVISDFVRNGMPDDLKQRAVVISNPFEFDVSGCTRARRSMVALTGADSPTIAFVGTLQEQKRPDVFIRAASIIRGRYPDTHFLMVGRDGGLEADMRRLAGELGLSGAITFAGFRADVTSLLAGCDMLLAPAVDEGHGRALIEAMACGVPVVASDSGGHREIVRSGETGLLVPSDEPEALAAAAIEFMHAPDKAHASAANALNWVKATFSPQTHARAIDQCYDHLLQA